MQASQKTLAELLMIERTLWENVQMVECRRSQSRPAESAGRAQRERRRFRHPATATHRFERRRHQVIAHVERACRSRSRHAY